MEITLQRPCGPTLKNILINPEVTVFSDTEINPDERQVMIGVTGLICEG